MASFPATRQNSSLARRPVKMVTSVKKLNLIKFTQPFKSSQLVPKMISDQLIYVYLKPDYKKMKQLLICNNLIQID